MINSTIKVWNKGANVKFKTIETILAMNVNDRDFFANYFNYNILMHLKA